MYRGIIHVHSCYSPDSVTPIGSILRVAKRLSLDFLILTDHDTIRGALALERLAATCGAPLETPVAAEYRTDHGDLIAAFIKTEIVSRRLDEFIAEVRQQQGLILLPHPFVDHTNVELLAEQADLVEIFNGRAGKLANDAAHALAIRLNKPSYWASDAHLGISLPSVVVAVESVGTLRESLLHGAVRPVKCSPVGQYDVVLSQLVKVVKERDIRRILRAPVRLLSRILGHRGARHRNSDSHLQKHG